MSGKYGRWITATIDIDATTVGEFTGFDADQYSGLVDLESAFSKVVVVVPTIVSATVSVYGVPVTGSTSAKETVPVAIHYRLPTTEATGADATTASEGGYIYTFNIGGFRYIRIKVSQNQTATDRVFYCKGVE